MMKHVLTAAGLAALALTPLVAQAQTGPLPYFTDFEGFMVNDPLNGQNGWSTLSDSTFVITDERAFSGTTSALINTGPTSGQQWSWIDIDPQFTASGSTTTLLAEAWIFIEDAAGSNGSSFGFDAYDPFVNRLAGVAANGLGEVFLFSGTTQTAASTTVTAPIDTWFRLELIMNTVTGVATAKLNGEDTGLSVNFDADSTIADVDLWADATNFERGFFDDFKLTAAPEPGTFALAGLGALVGGLALRRRRK